MENRLRVLLLIFILVFGFIIARLFYWQVIMAEQFGGQANNQSTRKLTIPSRRGTISAKDGSTLVTNSHSSLVYLEPKKIKDKQKTIETLASMLDMTVSTISAKLENDQLVWVPIAHKIPDDIKQKLQNKNIPGLGFEEEDTRYYPEGSMSAQLLGFVGKDAKGNDKGYFGIEGYYDRQLEGRNGYLEQETDARGLPILMGQVQRVDPENGRDLILNIDKSIQFIAETKLSAALEKYGAKGGEVVIMDPKSGDILAMSSYPSYDPRNFNAYDNSLYKNPLVADSYEPGSTFKVLIIGAALNEKKVTPGMIFDENGPIEVGGFNIHTWNDKYSGKITTTQILEKSSNVGMVEVGKLLGKDKLLEYINKVGVGALTGVDLEEEVSPQLRPQDKWYEIDYATSTFGQGIALTPIQMVRAIGAIANDGKMMEPHVVAAIIDPQGKKIIIQPKEIRQVFTSETAHVLSEMMVSAIDNGEAKFAKPKGYRIAGKTGTAQIPIAGHYEANKTIASFIGFAPIPNPKFVMLTILKEPSTSQWGSETAAPLFFSIAKELFRYYGIQPQE